jgi:hypothetical protein
MAVILRERLAELGVSLMVEKKISFQMQVETTATEESPVSSRH